MKEICETTAALIRDPNHDVMQTLPAPDFIGGCQIIYDENALRQVYETGKGGIKLRARYQYDKSANCIDVLSIPSTTTCEVIIEKIIDLVKAGKIKDIADVRDETGIDGLKITIDLKRGVDPDRLMAKLYRLQRLKIHSPATLMYLSAECRGCSVLRLCLKNGLHSELNV